MSLSCFHPLMQLSCLSPSKPSFLLRVSEVYLGKEVTEKVRSRWDAEIAYSL